MSCRCRLSPEEPGYRVPAGDLAAVVPGERGVQVLPVPWTLHGRRLGPAVDLGAYLVGRNRIEHRRVEVGQRRTGGLGLRVPPGGSQVRVHSCAVDPSPRSTVIVSDFAGDVGASSGLVTTEPASPSAQAASATMATSDTVFRIVTP